MGNVKLLIQKWVAILILLVIILGQYAITGYLATSYAIDLLATQSENVQFRAYFKNGEEELTEVQSSIDAKNLKLKIDVAVNNEGYFNGQISLVNAGFKLDEATANNYINRVENNVIYLNQINAEETANIEVGIKYFEEDKIQVSTLNQITTVRLNGTYSGSVGNTTIDAGSDVKVIWNIPENTKVELASKLQTNFIYSVNEQNKKIVQYLVSSKLTNNAYPVKNTNITANIPTGATNVEVHKRTTKATNGEQEFTTANYSVENNVLTINVNNTEIDGKNSWMKDVKDIFVITYEYPENTDLSSQTITINGKITAQNDVELNAEQVSLTLNEAIDGIASISKLQGENNIYKGKIYSGQGRDIISTSMVYVDYADGVKDVEITEIGSFGGHPEIHSTPEGDEVYITIDTTTDTTNNVSDNKDIILKSVKINKNKVASVFGDVWTLTIGENTITNESQADENGDIILTLDNEVNILKIKTSKPMSNGSFPIEITKTLFMKSYTRQQIKELSGFYDINSIKFTKNDNSTATSSGMNIINFKETESKASIQSEQTALIAGTTQPLTLTVVLESSGEHQDLYKNPHIKIKLPSQIQNVTYTQAPQLMFENGLELTNENYKVIEENGQKVLDIQLTGEQTSYLGEAIQGTSITINTNVQIDQVDATGNEEIVMTYTNENATIYTDNGTEKVNIQIASTQTQGENIGNESQETGNQETGNQETGSQGTENQGTENQGTENPGTESQGTENQETGNQETGNQGQSGNEAGNNGSNEQSNTQGDNTQNQVQGTVGQVRYSVSAKVGGETIQEGDTVKAGEIIEYTIRLENPTTENIQGVNISATVPENTTLMVEDPSYPEYNQEQGTHSTEGSPLIESSNTQVAKENITINGNGTKEFSYMVKVNSSLTETKEIEAQVTINSNNTNKIVKFINTIAKANLIATIKPLYRNSNEPLSFGYTYMYKVNIVNNTNEEQRNIRVTLNKNSLVDFKKMEHYTEDGIVDIEDTSFTIDSISANGSDSVTIYAGINKFTDVSKTAQMYLVIRDSQENEYRTNLISDKIGGVLANISLESRNLSNNGSRTLKEGDELLYQIVVKNTGTKIADRIDIVDKFSEYLELEDVTLNNTKYEYLFSSDNEENNVRYNKITINKELDIGEEVTIRIKGKLKANNTGRNVEIFNQASVFNEILLAETEKDVYYLQPSDNSQTDNNDQNNGDEGQNNNNEGQDNGNINKDENNQGGINNNGNIDVNTISGLAWLDENANGQKDSNEKLLEGINAVLFDIENNKQVSNTITDSNGLYYFSNISNGKYVVIFEYDTDIYSLTKYQAKNVSSNNNSDVENVTMFINGVNKKVAATDTLTINNNTYTNIDIGLVEAKKFDLSLSKTITKVSVSNSKENKEIKFGDTNLAKVEIKGKYLKGSVVVVEYKIKVTNNGELAGYAKKIVDNKPSDLKFNSKLNPDWYQSGNSLYTTSLANTQIEPGESKEVVLILTKTMTETNTGLSNNKAKILDYYNSSGIVDENSTHDDDISQADLIVSVSTGIAIKFTVVVVLLLIAISTFVYQVCKRIMKNNV